MTFTNNNKYLPILIIAYKRPRFLVELLLIIKSLKFDYKLYVFIDGYKNNEDRELVIKCQKLVNSIEIKNKITNFSSVNLGCGRGPVEAINWLFKNEPYGVILEEDCLPNQTFFPYCFELLKKYFTNDKIFHISGNQFDLLLNYDYSYLFSTESHNWGWATWRRAWNFYDYYIIPENERETIWDYQWQKTILKHNGITILPIVNLVKNVGFGEDATHTTDISDCHIRDVQEIDLPLKHPNLNFNNLYVSKSI
jgi:hypothetical protein